MNAYAERIMKTIVILAFGWLIGYMHHFVATQSVWENLGAQIRALGTEIAELKQIVSPLKQARRVSMKVTAYSNDPESIDVAEWRDGKTATGSTAAVGTVSSDWEVLAPGRRLFVPGYGFGVIADRGGMVRGNHIDVFMDSRDGAVRWGVKKMDVFVF